MQRWECGIATPYEVLGVPSDATAEMIQKAHRTAIKAVHPDLHPDPVNAELAKRLNAARDLLLHTPSRRTYDLQRRAHSERIAQERRYREQQSRQQAHQPAGGAAWAAGNPDSPQRPPGAPGPTPWPGRDSRHAGPRPGANVGAHEAADHRRGRRRGEQPAAGATAAPPHAFRATGWAGGIAAGCALLAVLAFAPLAILVVAFGWWTLWRARPSRGTRVNTTHLSPMPASASAEWVLRAFAVQFAVLWSGGLVLHLGNALSGGHLPATHLYHCALVGCIALLVMRLRRC